MILGWGETLIARGDMHELRWVDDSSHPSPLTYYSEVGTFLKVWQTVGMARFIRKTPKIPRTECAYTCPVRRTAQVIDGKWTTQIVRDLLPGKRRYSQLLAGLSGISPKILVERLRLLESHGLITKTIYAEVPPHTEYELTTLGRSLKDVIRAMARFGELLALREESDRG